MADNVKLVLDRVAREPALAQLILKDPRMALAPYRLSPEEMDKVLAALRTERVPPPG